MSFSFALADEDEELILLWGIPMDTPTQNLADAVYDKTGIVLTENLSAVMSIFNIPVNQKASLLGCQIDYMIVLPDENNNINQWIVNFATDRFYTESGFAVAADTYNNMQNAFNTMIDAYAESYGPFPCITVIFIDDQSEETYYSYSGELDDDFWYSIANDALVNNRVLISASKKNLNIKAVISYKELQGFYTGQAFLDFTNSISNEEQSVSYNEYTVQKNKEIKDVDVGI